MKAIAAIASIIGIFIVTPIWYWLLYQILVRVNATELMWFLFWVYVPLHLLFAFLARLVTEAKKT